MKKIKSLFFMTLMIVAAVFTGNAYIQNKALAREAILAKATFMSLNMPDTTKVLKKMKVNDILVENVQAKKELITMETELKEDVTWDSSFTEYEVFKKTQRLTFYATGKYSTDLSKLTADDIAYDYDNNVVTLEIHKPIINSLEINENKTMIYTTENGLLRFGEIKLTAAEQNEMHKKVKADLYTELNSKQMMEQAEANTADSVAELVSVLLSGVELGDVGVKVLFKA